MFYFKPDFVLVYMFPMRIHSGFSDPDLQNPDPHNIEPEEECVRIPGTLGPSIAKQIRVNCLVVMVV